MPYKKLLLFVFICSFIVAIVIRLFIWAFPMPDQGSAKLDEPKFSYAQAMGGKNK